MEASRPAVRRARTWSTAAVPVVFMAVVFAGCGLSGSQPGVASLGGPSHNGATGGTTGSGPTVNGNGGGGGGGVTSSGGGPGQSSGVMLAGGKNSLQFSECMRSHGVKNFPDPGANGAISFSGAETGSPAFNNAMNACRKYLGGSGKPLSPAQQQKLESELLQFAACMRSSGVPNYPDPQFTGNAVRQTIQGIDPNSPAYLHAQQACKKYLSGLPGDKTGIGGGPAPAGAGGKQ